MSDWKQRLTRDLEPVLRETDPRARISAYHNMPYAIFHYPPEEEIPLRAELALLSTRLEQIGKRVTSISLAKCLADALAAEGLTTERIASAEKHTGTEKMVDTIHMVISNRRPLDDLVAARIPQDANPTRDIVLIVRAGSLFPFYRTSSLLEQIKGKIEVPAVLFYPGVLDGVAGLRFMGVLEAERNYRPKIF
jgi:hypothetical protein